MVRKIVVALSGASGAGYCVELLKGLQKGRKGKEHSVHLVHSSNALKILKDETGLSRKDLMELCDEVLPDDRLDHMMASGSNKFASMVICPCSTSTACKVHAGIADNLTTRLASVALKERRMLVLVVRETPLSTPVLKALYELSSWGAVIMPASPPFYGLGEDSIRALQRGFAGRVLDLLGAQNDMAVRYSPGPKGPR